MYTILWNSGTTTVLEVRLAWVHTVIKWNYLTSLGWFHHGQNGDIPDSRGTLAKLVLIYISGVCHFSHWKALQKVVYLQGELQVWLAFRSYSGVFQAFFILREEWCFEFLFCKQVYNVIKKREKRREMSEEKRKGLSTLNIKIKLG